MEASLLSPSGWLVDLPFEFNRAERAWFCQRRTQVENSGREQTDYRWTRIDGSFPLVECDWPARRGLGYGNTLNCGNCHGSQIVVNYEKSTEQMATRPRRYPSIVSLVMAQESGMSL